MFPPCGCSATSSAAPGERSPSGCPVTVGCCSSRVQRSSHRVVGTARGCTSSCRRREMGIHVVDMHLADVSVPADPLIAGQTNGSSTSRCAWRVHRTHQLRWRADRRVHDHRQREPAVGGHGAGGAGHPRRLCTACTFSSQNVPIPDFFGGARQSRSTPHSSRIPTSTRCSCRTTSWRRRGRFDQGQRFRCQDLRFGGDFRSCRR